MARTLKTVLLFVAIAAALAVLAEAECCKRKGNFGCCGNGPCNILCCNCDNGCNSECENTHCDSGDWAACAGLVIGCRLACNQPDSPFCERCMGSQYSACKKCFPDFLVSSLEDNRNQFFHDVASLGASASNITKEAFARYIDSAGRALDHSLDEAFALYDGNQDGVIDRDEFDAPHIIGFQRESGLETVV